MALQKVTSTVTCRGEPIRKNPFVVTDCDDFLPFYAIRERYTVYVEDNFPWWYIRTPLIRENNLWFIIGVDGYFKVPKTTILDLWIEKKYQIKSKRRYVTVEYTKNNEWQFNVNHTLINVEHVFGRMQRVLYNISDIKYTNVTYSLACEEINIRALAVAIAHPLIDWIAVNERKYILTDCNTLDLAYGHMGKKFFCHIDKSNPTSILIDNIENATEEDIIKTCDDIIALSKNNLYASSVCESLVTDYRYVRKYPKEYTRFASINNTILPEIINPVDVPRVEAEGRTVLPYEGALYTCPINYVPCLTENRKMSNNDTVKFVVKCNSRGKPNLQRRTETSKYVFLNQSHMLQENDHGECRNKICSLLSIPTSSVRVGVIQDSSAFIRAVLKALELKIDPIQYRRSHKFNPWIVKQENPYCTPTEIVETFRVNDANPEMEVHEVIDGERYYRLLEEAFDINIILVTLSKNNVDFCIPNVVDSNKDEAPIYVWTPKIGKRSVIIVKNLSIETGAFRQPCYEYIQIPSLNVTSSIDKTTPAHVVNTNASAKYFHNALKNKVIRFAKIPHIYTSTIPILSVSTSNTTSPLWTGQQVNKDGICIGLEKNGVWYSCLSAPHDLPQKSIDESKLPLLRSSMEPECLLNSIGVIRSPSEDVVAPMVDIYRKQAIGIWVTPNLYYPIQPTSLDICTNIPRGPRYLYFKRSIFKESITYNKPKFQIIYGTDNIQSWIQSLTLRHGTSIRTNQTFASS